MRALAVVLLLAACTGPKPDPDYVSPRQQPSVTTPGVTVSGDVSVGVLRRF
ncbi:hypothetical protein KDD17_02010 [Sulfitobacter albidus]|uniref:Uncharacterized protein n=1 Tax=Sulfitobacter albidus TaxID=2829501 RepID=A0A975JE77_9RHOB|nr:hypothetical protein [Sulfitobacter albidus]QUJ76861.1 hypothetical protein KDD17_02010 [Sulfitobacter albidus]